MKIFDPCHSRYVPLRAELVLLRGGLPSEIALQVQNCVSKGRWGGGANAILGHVHLENPKMALENMA